jgi:tetratricopeptide (TPR) repeat protein
MDGTSGTPQEPSANDSADMARVGADDVQAQLTTMKSKIDALQIGMAEKSRPWYKQAATMIALAALLFSGVTTWYSEKRIHEQDIHSARQELSQLIQRLGALPKENLELRETYSKDPVARAALSGLLSQENDLLAKRAAEIIDTLPPRRVSAIEYHAVASALTQSGVYDRSLQMIQRGLGVADDANDRTALLRNYAQLLYETGDLAGGQAKFQEALDIFKRYPVSVTWYVDSTHAITELLWAQNEIGQRRCAEAQAHVQRAADHISRVRSDRWGLAGQLRQTQAFARTCQPTT